MTTSLPDALQAEIGVPCPPSPWITIDQSMIDRFATLTFDDQWIHTDRERAAASPVGATVAHGFLTLSLASRFAYDSLSNPTGLQNSVNYGFDRIRFVTPVRAGEAVRGHLTVTDVTRRAADTFLRRCALTIEIRNQPKPALVADWLTLLHLQS